MKLFDKIKAAYNSFGFGTERSPTEYIAAQKKITTNLASYLIDLSSFQDMEDNRLYSQLYTWEASIGGAIDRLTTMVAQAYHGITKKADGIDEDLDPKAVEKCLKLAKQIAEGVNIRNQFETLAEMLLIYGNVYLLKKDDLSYEILPPEYVTFVEKMTDVNVVNATEILTKPQYLVLNERGTVEVPRKVYPLSKIVHIKYKDTPQLCKDMMGRPTYGIYAVSPLHRTVIPIWWSRQITIIDILWRARSIPREHHKIQSDVYSLDKYDGSDWKTKRAAAKLDAETFMNTYASTIVEQAPDQGYVTLDTIKIETVGGGNTTYMKTNELLAQIEDHVWTALNVPPSVVNGSGSSSFASELVISNYVSSKVVQLAEKIKPTLLTNLKERVLMIDRTLPVEVIDIKIELSMAASQTEMFRQMVLMGQLGTFTEDEIRDYAGYDPLSDEQKEHIVNLKGAGQTAHNTTDGGDMRQGEHPDTPMSDASHTNDLSQRLMKDEEEQ